jgi:hypothetical protein
MIFSSGLNPMLKKFASREIQHSARGRTMRFQSFLGNAFQRKKKLEEFQDFFAQKKKLFRCRSLA